MNVRQLAKNDVLAAYDKVCALYSLLPSLSLWRAWEYAAYRLFELNGRVLDLGCGDGRYFRLLWPEICNVVGVDQDSVVAEQGRSSGVYRHVHVAPAHAIPEVDGVFDHVFANCSLEHMDHLDGVIAEVFRCLKPGGTLLCSVVTDRFIGWSPLPAMIKNAGYDVVADQLQQKILDYHHLVNPLTVDDWKMRFSLGGLVLEEHVPILPKYNSGSFLLIDSLWHIKCGEGELGDLMHRQIYESCNFPSAFRKIFEGLIEMETNLQDCSGAVFLVRKPLS